MRLKLRSVIDGLAHDPRPHGSEDLKGKLALYRKLRVGNYRIVYEIDDGAVSVLVVRVGDRKDVYR